MSSFTERVDMEAAPPIGAARFSNRDIGSFDRRIAVKLRAESGDAEAKTSAGAGLFDGLQEPARQAAEDLHPPDGGGQSLFTGNGVGRSMGRAGGKVGDPVSI